MNEETLYCKKLLYFIILPGNNNSFDDIIVVFKIYFKNTFTQVRFLTS